MVAQPGSCSCLLHSLLRYTVYERISCFDAPGGGKRGTLHILSRGGVHYDPFLPDNATPPSLPTRARPPGRSTRHDSPPLPPRRRPSRRESAVGETLPRLPRQRRVALPARARAVLGGPAARAAVARLHRLLAPGTEHLLQLLRDFDRRCQPLSPASPAGRCQLLSRLTLSRDGRSSRPPPSRPCRCSVASVSGGLPTAPAPAPNLACSASPPHLQRSRRLTTAIPAAAIPAPAAPATACAHPLGAPPPPWPPAAPCAPLVPVPSPGSMVKIGETLV